MKYVKAIMIVGLFLAFAYSQALAASATATVSATVPSVLTVALGRDAGSATRGTATSILFDKLDSQDGTGGDAGFMYAPYRTAEASNNWHILKIASNGPTMKLAVSVSGTVAGTPLASLLKLFCGGFFLTGSSSFIDGTKSDDWEFAQGWQRTLSQPFIGTVPFNYQLNVSTVLSSSTAYTGTVQFTLTTT
jgi:hypothetical protein